MLLPPSPHKQAAFGGSGGLIAANHGRTMRSGLPSPGQRSHEQTQLFTGMTQPLVLTTTGSQTCRLTSATTLFAVRKAMVIKGVAVLRQSDARGRVRGLRTFEWSQCARGILIFFLWLGSEKRAAADCDGPLALGIQFFWSHSFRAKEGSGVCQSRPLQDWNATTGVPSAQPVCLGSPVANPPVL